MVKKENKKKRKNEAENETHRKIDEGNKETIVECKMGETKHLHYLEDGERLHLTRR